MAIVSVGCTKEQTTTKNTIPKSEMTSKNISTPLPSTVLSTNLDLELEPNEHALYQFSLEESAYVNFGSVQYASNTAHIQIDYMKDDSIVKTHYLNGNYNSGYTMQELLEEGKYTLKITNINNQAMVGNGYLYKNKTGNTYSFLN